MVQTIYFICIILCSISAAVYMIYNRRRVIFSFAIMEILFVLSNMGYYVLAGSTEVGEALLANKITYIGSCVLPVVLFLTISHICNVRINPIPGTLMGIYSLFVFIMSMTPGYTDWYYKDVKLGKYYDATILIKEYGWAHDLFTILLYGCLLLSVGLLIYILALKKNVSLKNVIILLIIESLSIALFIASRFLAKNFEVTSIVYVIDSIGILAVSIRTASYNIEDSIVNSIMEKRDYGYIIIDRKGVFLGCDKTSKEFISCLNDLRIDKQIPDTFPFKETFMGWIQAFEQKQDLKTIYNDERFLKCNIRYLYANGKANGYLLEIVDDTKQQEYIRLLDQVAKNKSDFLSNMSHEIRTPVNAILGMNEMILKECNDKNIVEYAEDIDSSGRLLSALINDILDFSKIESGKMKIVPVEYNLKVVISNLIKMIHIRLEKKGLQFVLNADSKTPSSLFGDEIRIQQIVTNLLTNAVKYTDTGTVILHVGYEELQEDKCQLVIKVEDTGKGIKDSEKEKLFTAFERIDEEKNRNVEGTGLGLAITSRFVHIMGGSITVESEYGKGSVFSVKLPQDILLDEKGNYEMIGSQDDIFSMVRVRKDDNRRLFKAPDARILVVDDTEMNLKVVARFLKNTDIKLDMVKSGVEAIEKTKVTQYDIILMDHMMPEMDGIECLQHMITNKLIGATPVIALTANAVSDVQKEYLSNGFKGYMLKPFKSVDLENLILEYIPAEKIRWEM